MFRIARKPPVMAQIVGWAVVIVSMVYFLKPESNEEVARVAVILPESGEDAHAGWSMRAGIEAAVSYLEDTAEVRFVFYDDRSHPDGARVSAREVAADPEIVGVIGHYASREARAALPIYRRHKLTVILPSATDDSLTLLAGMGKSLSHVFRLPPPNQRQAQNIVEMLNELRIEQVFLVRDTSAYSKSLSESIHNLLLDQDIAGRGIMGTHIIQGGQEDYLSFLNQNIQEVADGIVFLGYGTEAAYFANQLKKQEWCLPVIASDGVYGVSFRRKIVTVPDNWITLYPYSREAQSSPEEGKQAVPWSDFEAQWEKHCQKPCDMTDVQGWGAWAFDAGIIANRLVRLAKTSLGESSLERHAFWNYLEDEPMLGEVEGVLYEYDLHSRNNMSNGSYQPFQLNDNRSKWIRVSIDDGPLCH